MLGFLIFKINNNIRIINNVFSNVLKYADIKQPVYITLLIDEDIENLGLTIKNTKKHSANDVSTKIRLLCGTMNYSINSYEKTN